MTMEYIAVSGSSNVAAIGYDNDTNTLGVQFIKGGTYHYFDVPPHVFDEFKAASSKGTFLDQHIKKGGYRYNRV